MKKSILITGGSGSGKTTICEMLISVGYEAYDIETIPGLFTLVNKTTRQSIPLEAHDNLDIEKVRQVEWLCNRENLEKLISNQKGNVAFYCGLGNNIAEVFPLFTTVILLKTSLGVTQERLSTRRTSDFGHAQDVRDWILRRDELLEREIEKQADIVLENNNKPEQCTRIILKEIGTEVN